VLQTMADQLAIAIENTRLLQDMEEAVRELERASGRYTRESWRAVTDQRERPPGYRYRRLGIEPVETPPPEARQAWQQGRPVLVAAQSDADDDGQRPLSTLAVPMRLRGQVVGVLTLRFEGDPVTFETTSLIEEIASRLALALENARLLEETQRRAERDRLVAGITGRVRSSMDLETILRTTVQELGSALGAERTLVRLATTAPPPESGRL